jgi:hypothetical protein
MNNNSKKDATSAVPNVDTLFSRKKTKSVFVKTPPLKKAVTTTVKSVTPPKKKSKKPVSPPKVEKKKTPPPPKKKVIPAVVQEATPIQENKSIGVDNINSIVDSLENISIMDIISSTENPDMTTMFNNLLAIS